MWGARFVQEIIRVLRIMGQMQSLKDVKMIVPNNFQHQAGDGTATRKHRVAEIVPALQANCGATQCSYVLEVYDED